VASSVKRLARTVTVRQIGWEYHMSTSKSTFPSRPESLT
jgi:hypothetical protein